MAHVNCKFLHLAFNFFGSAIIFIFSLERSETSQLQIPNQQRTVQQKNNSGERHNSDTRKASRQAKTIRYKCATRKREKETGGGICFQFPPSGRCILLSMAGRVVLFFFRGGTERLFFFPRRDGAVVVFFRGGTGRLYFFPRRDGVAFFFFFDETGRGGVFFFFRGPGRDGCFWRWHFFWRDGAKSLHRPAKGGLNRPASRPCKALENFPQNSFCTIEHWGDPR